MPSAAMEIRPAGLPADFGIWLVTAVASSGSAGISQRYCTIQGFILAGG